MGKEAFSALSNLRRIYFREMVTVAYQLGGRLGREED